MAQLTNVQDSYDSVNINKESLADVIYGLNPAETPLLSNAAQGKARATLHEWTSDAWVASTTNNAQVEGDEYANASIAVPARNTNQLQISNKVVSVTETQMAVDQVGAQDAMAYAVAKYGQLLKNDVEAIICGNQAATAGTNNTTEAIRTLRSFEAWVPTGNSSLGASGAAGTTTQSATDGTQRAFNEDLFLDVLQAMYTAGARPDLAILPAKQKRIFGGFTGASFRNTNVADKTVTAVVDIYVSDFGEVKAMVSRYVRARSVLIAEKEKLEVAYLRPFNVIDLAKTGSAERKAIEVEYTFVPRNPSALGRVADLT